MKVLGITAGRKGGNSEIMLKTALEECERLGAEVIMVNLYDYKIHHCLGCSMCGGNETAQDALSASAKGNCLWSGKDGDEMEKIMEEYLDADGVILSIPTYDLMPSGLYLTFANRTITYEAGFLRMKGIHLKDRVAGLISVGGSSRAWQSMALEGLQATVFTQSIQVVDQYLCTGVTLKGHVIIREDHLEKAKEVAQHVIEAIKTPVDERKWLGDPDMGWCPVCHSNALVKGEKHWDGIYWPIECQVCGAGGDLEKQENGSFKFVIAEDGMLKCRVFEKSRDKHFEEVMHFHSQTQVPENKEKIKAGMQEYLAKKFKKVEH